MELSQVELFYRFGAALGLGLLIGLQREYSYVVPDERSFAGARTFTLLALAGCLAAFLTELSGSPWPLVAALVTLGFLIITAYFVTSHDGHIGATTEVTALITVGVGALCYWGQIVLAAAITVAILVLLSLKLQMQSFVRRIDRQDIIATLKLAVITVIVLPLLPNQGIGPPPFDVLNPYRIWLMVVFIAGLNFLGYVISQLVEPTQGIGLTGLLGGLVSSTAVTLSFTQRSRAEPFLARPFAIAILVAWAVMFVRVIVEAAVVNFSLLTLLIWPMALSAGIAVAYSGYLFFTSRRNVTADVQTRNPFQLGPAVQFGLIYGLILLAVRSAEFYLGTTGIYLSSIVAGMADVDAITLSMSQLSSQPDGIEMRTAAIAITLAAMTNTIVKGTIVAFVGAPGLRRAIIPGVLAILLAGSVIFFL